VMLPMACRRQCRLRRSRHPPGYTLDLPGVQMSEPSGESLLPARRPAPELWSVRSYQECLYRHRPLQQTASPRSHNHVQQKTMTKSAPMPELTSRLRQGTFSGPRNRASNHYRPTWTEHAALAGCRRRRPHVSPRGSGRYSRGKPRKPADMRPSAGVPRWNTSRPPGLGTRIHCPYAGHDKPG
jgi:hypothetical protein